MKLMRQVVTIAAVLALAGCGASSEDELRQWMTEQKGQTRPRIAPISEPKQFIPESYGQVATIEPFSNQKLTQALKRDSTQAAANGAAHLPLRHSFSASRSRFLW